MKVFATFSNDIALKDTSVAIANSKIVKEVVNFVLNLVHTTMKYLVPFGLLFWLVFFTNSHVLATSPLCVNDTGVPGPCPEGVDQDSKQGEI